ncbi:hypothetical protein [Chryseobacterium sp. WLY505]|uniref:hypothetical protein n=1 Tax=Chryseobacterium sp. WLY505 TaxID=3068892 RepID=UPI00279659CD|nr:hypothetical protein [Chryseobacterium sp. WLY505]MDQ1856008.1 hypothetical protein [Chryseobacterium sp. WLY505]
MKTKTNVFLDFDNTQFDGHLHNTMIRYTGEYEDHDIPGLTKKQLMKELMGTGPLSEESKQAVQEALADSAKIDVLKAKNNPKYKAHTFDFFDAEGLNELAGKSKGQGVDVVVLTASMFPNAIKAVYEMNGLTHLKDISIISVPINTNRTKMAEDKNTEIQKYEENQRLKDKELHTVHNIFVDDSKENIQVFTKSRNPATNIGILTPDGIGKVMKSLEKEIENTLEKKSGKQESVSAKVNPRESVENQNTEEEEGLYAYRDNKGELHSSKHKYKENVFSTGKNDMRGNLSMFTETQNQPQRNREQGLRAQASHSKGMDNIQVAPALPPRSPKVDPNAPALPPKGKVDQAPPVPSRTKANQAPAIPPRGKVESAPALPPRSPKMR